MKIFSYVAVSLVFITTPVAGALTEEQFAAEVLAQVSEYDDALDALDNATGVLTDELRQLLIPPPGQRNTSRLEQLTELLESYDDDVDVVVNNKKTYLKGAEEFCESKFGKNLLRVVPLPGTLDFGVAVVLAIDTQREFGTVAVFGDLFTSALPDIAQVFSLSLGGGILAGAVAIINIQEASDDAEKWIKEYNEMLRDTDPMRKRVRTNSGTAGAIAALQAAKLKVQLAPSIAIHDGEVVMYRNRAKDLLRLEFLKGMMIDLQEYEEYEKFKKGDINWDGAVDLEDVQIMQNNWGRTDLDQFNRAESTAVSSGDYGDLDGDGDVDLKDFLLMQ